MDTYALIKTLLSRQSLRQSPALVVNQAEDEATAVDVHRRIKQALDPAGILNPGKLLS